MPNSKKTQSHWITVKDIAGEVLYDGPDKREPGGIVVGPLLTKRKFFDLKDITFTDLMKFAGIVITGFVLMARLDTRLMKLEGETAAITQAMSKVVDFIKNSDGYHSAIIGLQFENGKPINTNYEVQKIRKFASAE